jgi:ABC-type transporter Mla subunit MlaD
VYPNNNIHAELIRQMRRLGETFRDGQVNRQHQLASITNELVTLSHRHQERDQHFSMIHQQLNRMVHANHLMATEYQELQHCLEKTVLKVGLQQL